MGGQPGSHPPRPVKGVVRPVPADVVAVGCLGHAGLGGAQPLADIDEAHLAGVLAGPGASYGVEMVGPPGGGREGYDITPCRGVVVAAAQDHEPRAVAGQDSPSRVELVDDDLVAGWRAEIDPVV